MILKRKISFNIPYFAKFLIGVVGLVLFCINFSNGQIKITNPCAIDYNQIVGSVPPKYDQSGNLIPPGDPTNVYYTATTFVDLNPTSTGGSWNFGDGSPIVSGKVVNHQYATDGTFIVTFTPNVGIPSTQNVTIRYAPRAPYFLGSYSKRDTSLCADLRLDPYKSFAPSNVSYQWYPDNSTGSTLLATTSDLYTVKVTDNATGCSISGSISVIICGTPNPPLQSIAEYHFGNGIKRVANHGNAAFATEYPIGEDYENSGILNTSTAASSVSNPNPFHYQRYMFSTDGSTIYGSQGQIIANNISGNNKKAKQTIIIPKMEADTIATTQYYILTVNEDDILSYTLIDNSGKAEGDASVIDKNVQLLNNMNGKLTVSKYYKTATFSGYYAIVAGNDGNYYTFTITQMGIQGPIQSPGVGAGKNEMGQLKFSPDGSKLISAISAPPFNQIMVCNFDSTNGGVSGCTPISLGTGPQKLYGIEYSPDGNYIYYTLIGASGQKSEFRRYDVLNGTSTLIQRADNNEEYGALEAYKVPGYLTEIVMAVNGEKYIATLERPNALISAQYLSNDADTTVAFRQDILKFTLKAHRFIFAKSTLGLNNAVELAPNSSPSSDAMQFESDCVDKAISFQATPKCDVDQMQIKYEWDFGDGSPIGTKQQESHTYTAPGQYIVKLFISYCGKAPVEITDLIVIIPKPFTNLAAAYENCFKLLNDFPIPVKVTNLKDLDIIYASQLEYEWTGNSIVSGANKNIVVVNGKTDLKLKVTYYNIEPFKACPNEFSTKVLEFCPPTFVVPDIFTPNGDGTNDKLTLGVDELDSDNYFFRIYNRWGELVYFSKTLPEPNPWDGKFKGKMVESDSFAWTVEYRSRFKPDGITYKNKGALVVVR